MASSSFSLFSFLFLLVSPLVFLSGVNSTLSDLAKACEQISEKNAQKVCLDYVLGFAKTETSKDENIDLKEFTEGFIVGAETSGHEMITRLKSLMKEKKSADLQDCIYSYEASTDTTTDAYNSFRKKDYTQAASKLLQASTGVWNCDKALEKTDLLESHKMFVEMVALPITFIDTIQNSTKSS